MSLGTRAPCFSVFDTFFKKSWNCSKSLEYEAPESPNDSKQNLIIAMILASLSFIIIDKEWLKVGSSQQLVGIHLGLSSLFHQLPHQRHLSLWVVGGNRDGWFFPIIGWHSFVSADVINGRPYSDWSMIDWHWSLLHFCTSVFLYFCISVFLYFCISVFLYFCISVCGWMYFITFY